MDVELYVYDLSKGLARQFSYSLTGIYLDAIYHTSLVFGGVEYFFGQGIHHKIPGSTHHGQPMEVLSMGKTELPMDVIAEYLASLAEIYTAESYDLFVHNCNNFTQDLSMFLVGKGIPEKIQSLPQRFLETPIGQMLRTQIDQSMRSMTQAPDADVPITAHQRALSSGQGVSNESNGLAAVTTTDGTPNQAKEGKVHNVTTAAEIDLLLKAAKDSCAVMFFTSATCPPCKLVYPAYDELAAEAGHQATLIKVDLSKAHSLNAKYQVRATPTFMTFLKGQKENEWSGANEAQLRGNVRLLIQMAWPLHPHRSLTLPTFERIITEPVTFKKIPPLEKLQIKIGRLAEEPPLMDAIDFINRRENSGQIEAPLPNLQSLSDLLCSRFTELPPETHFAVIDLVRILAIDKRASAFFATEMNHRTLSTLISSDSDLGVAPYNIQVVTLQLACNLFTSPLTTDQLAHRSENNLGSTLESIAASCLLAEHPNTRYLASALVYNMTILDHNARLQNLPEKLEIDTMESVEAALIEAVINEDMSRDALHGLLLALGMLLYCADVNGSTWDLCRAMEVQDALQKKTGKTMLLGEKLVQEVGEELLGKGGKA